MIEKIRIRNFKSLFDAEIALGPLTILIGANNTGKSSFLDVIQAFGRLTTHGASGLFDKARFHNLVSNREGRNPAQDHIELCFSICDEENGKCEYRLTLASPDHDQVVIHAEHFSVDGNTLIKTNDQDGTPNLVIGPGQKHSMKLPASDSGLKSMAARFSKKELSLFQARKYLLNPKSIKQSERPDSRSRTITISETGEQTALAIDELASRKIKKHGEFMKKLRDFAPEIEMVTAPGVDNNQRQIAIMEKGMEEAIGGDDISDGLAYLIAILAILSTSEDLQTLGIEEPENGIHPRRLKDLAAYFKQMAERKANGDKGIPQIVLTTHSPYLIDYFQDMTDAIVVVERTIEKGTTFKPLLEILNEKEDLDEMRNRGQSLGELWFNGFFGGVPR